MARARGFLVAALGVASIAFGCQLVAGLHEPRKAHCANGIADGDEQGVDCGDPAGECPRCAGASCTEPADCTSFTCNDGKCADPSCVASAPKECWICHTCIAGDPCASHADCITGRCLSGACTICTADGDCPAGHCSPGGVCLEVTCHNKVQDNDEQGVDCGGGCEKSCSDAGVEDAGDGGDAGVEDAGVEDAGDGGDAGDAGMTCSNENDCPSGSHCLGDQCVPHCQDGILDDGETGTDCGGPCDPCADGEGCGGPSDCQSMLCVGNVCQPSPFCSNGMTDGTETDTDCGGLVCPRCTQGKHCESNADCTSMNCDLTLSPPTCL
ncbi:MAG: hypothetical protein QM820_56305 [Minicystis sp.]